MVMPAPRRSRRPYPPTRIFYIGRASLLATRRMGPRFRGDDSRKDLRSNFSSHPENLRISRLDLVGPFLDRLGVLLHQLDIGELAHAGLLDCLLVGGILARIVDQDLLARARM